LRNVENLLSRFEVSIIPPVVSLSVKGKHVETMDAEMFVELASQMKLATKTLDVKLKYQ
jgi:hypothetical protein